MQVPLTAEDKTILALEDARLVGHTATVVHLPGGAPDLRRLRDSVTRRLSDAPRLTWRLSGTPDEPVWRSDEVDVAAHVRAVGAARPLDGSGLRAALVRLFGERLDRNRPLWRMDMVGPVAGRSCAWPRTCCGIPRRAPPAPAGTAPEPRGQGLPADPRSVRPWPAC